MTARSRLIILGSLSYLVIGMAHVVAGAVLEPMMGAYGLAYSDGGQFIMNQFLGFLAGVLLSPWLSARLGRRGAVMFALAVLFAAEVVYSTLPPWGWMLAVAPAAGFGFGLTEAIIGALVIDSIRERTASAMTLIETFFGVGALIMPAAAALLIRFDNWRIAFPLVAGASLLALILWQMMSRKESRKGPADHADSGAERTPASAAAAPAGRLRYQPAQLLFLSAAILYFLFYVGMEMGFSNYLPSILVERTAMTEASAAAGLSLFWGAMVIGRLVAGRIAERFGYARYLLGATLGGIAAMLMVRLASGPEWSLVWIAASGLAWSGVFAIALVYVNQAMPGMTDRTTSLLVAFGGAGGAVFPRLSGWMMDRLDAAWTLNLFAAMAVVMLLLLVAKLALSKRLRRSGQMDA